MPRRRRIGGKSKEQDASAIRVLSYTAPTPASATDHGTLAGLGDDDHSQYVHISAARTITAQHSFSPSTPQAPFLLGANAQGQVVTGLDADTVDGSHLADIDQMIQAQYVVLAAHASLDVERVLTQGAGLTITDAGAGSTVTVALATPGTLSVSSSNSATSPHSHAVTSSSNPGAAASLLASDSSGYLTLVRLKTDTITDRSGGNLTISPAGDVIFDPTGNDLLPNTGYDLNIGSLSKKYLTLHAAELWVETLVAQDTIATIGGRVLVGPTTVLTGDIGTGDTTIYVKHNQMASGDRVYMEADGKVEFMAITSAAGGGGPYSYSVTRNLDGSGANSWYAGDAVFNTGTTGDGFIDLYSIRSVKSATEYGPTIVGNVRNSSTYNDWSAGWAIGNLNGLYGYGTDTMGVGLGKYATGLTNVVIDPTDGVRIRDYTQTRLQASLGKLKLINADGTDAMVLGSSDATNLVLNPGFETAGGGGADVFADWTEVDGSYGTITQDNTIFHAGSYSCKLVRTAGAVPFGVYQQVAVTGSQAYQFSWYARGDGDVESYGIYQIYDVTNGDYYALSTSDGVTGTTFTQVTSEFITKNNTTAVRIYLYGPLTTGRSHWYDTVTLTPTAAAVFNSEITLSNESGIWTGIYGTFSNPNTGIKLYRDSSGEGIFEIWKSGTKKVYIDGTDRSLNAGALSYGRTFINDAGVHTVTSVASNERPFQHYYDDSGTLRSLAQFRGHYDTSGSGTGIARIESYRNTGDPWADTYIRFKADDNIAGTEQSLYVFGDGGIGIANLGSEPSPPTVYGSLIYVRDNFPFAKSFYGDIAPMFRRVINLPITGAYLTNSSYTRIGTNNYNTVINFPNNINSIAQWTFMLDQDFKKSIDAKLMWTHTGTDTGDVYWSLEIAYARDATTLQTSAYDSAAAYFTAPAQNEWEWDTLVGIDLSSLTVGDIIQVKLARLGADSGDTLEEDVYVTNLEFINVSTGLW